MSELKLHHGVVLTGQLATDFLNLNPDFSKCDIEPIIMNNINYPTLVHFDYNDKETTPEKLIIFPCPYGQNKVTVIIYMGQHFGIISKPLFTILDAAKITLPELVATVAVYK